MEDTNVTVDNAQLVEDTLKVEESKKSAKALKAEKAAAKKVAKVEPIIEEEAKVEPIIEEEAKVEPIIEEEAKVEPVIEEEAKVEPVIEEEAKVEPVVESTLSYRQLPDSVKREIREITKHIGINGFYKGLISKYENGEIDFRQLKLRLLKYCRMHSWMRRVQKLSL